jgi:hypothetical protein
MKPNTEFDKDLQELKDEAQAIPKAMNAMGNNILWPAIPLLILVLGLVWILLS